MLSDWQVQDNTDEKFENHSTGMMIGSAVTMLVLWFRDVFPVELIWLEAAAQVIGGGNPVAMGLLLSIIADATTEEER